LAVDLVLEVEALMRLAAAVVAVHGRLVTVAAIGLLLHGREQLIALKTIFLTEQVLGIPVRLHPESE